MYEQQTVGPLNRVYFLTVMCLVLFHCITFYVSLFIPVPDILQRREIVILFTCTEL